MSEGSYHIQEDETERPKSLANMRVVGSCILLLGLTAAVCGSSWTNSEGKSVSAVNMPVMKTGLQTRQVPAAIPPMLPRGAAFLKTSIKPGHQGAGLELPASRGSVAVPRAHFTDSETKFNYDSSVDFDYQEIPASDLQELLNRGWILLDVRPQEQVARAKVEGALEVPLYVTKNDFKSPLGLWQEACAWGAGGWWAGTRPMKENHDFVAQVMDKVSSKAPFTGIIVGCQTGLRSKQALKELHLAGFQPKLALIKGGFDHAKPGELCSGDECILPHGASIQLAGSGNIAGMLGWHHT
jgi:rhodanese-related sulfurtransferase